MTGEIAVEVTGVVGVSPALWYFRYIASIFLTLHKRLCTNTVIVTIKEMNTVKCNWRCDDIIYAIIFLLVNIFVCFDIKVFSQIVGIPMGMNCGPLCCFVLISTATCS